VQKHFIGHQVLLDDVLAIDGDDSGTDEEMKVVGLMPRPACFPQAQCIRLDEFTLEAQ